MRIVGFEINDALRLGIVDGDTVVDLQAADPRVPADLGEWLQVHEGDLAPLQALARRAPAAARQPLACLRFGLPVARPGKILCLGLNYLEHAKEGGHARPQFPSVFLRCSTSLVPHQAPILSPSRPRPSTTRPSSC
jgi:2-keto-4-pentenoate hydratase/2-oxohepta-3-ene-1,7-dioic acid hydratase in catechol pathway